MWKWSIAALVLVLTALAFAWRSRVLQARQAALERVKGVHLRLASPFPATLTARHNQLNRALTQLSSQIEEGRTHPDKLLEQLPRLEQQVQRLVQDQARHARVEEVQKRLIELLTRLEHAPKGSELADLNLVARNALRLTQGQLEEGELETARATAQEAIELLEKQVQELETARDRLPDLLARVTSLTQLALDCSAPILVRSRWESIKERSATLQRLVEEQRLIEGVNAASKLIPLLEAVHKELAERLFSQIDEARSKTRDRLEPLSSWPPDAQTLREEVASLLVSSEKPLPARRSLSDVWKGLELSRTQLERANALSLEHSRRWQARLETLLMRLETNLVNERLREYRSLPGPLVEEGRTLRRLRTRLEAARDNRAPWEACADVEQLLDREAELVEHAEALHAQIKSRLAQVELTLLELTPGLELSLLEPAKLNEIRTLLAKCQNALSRLELAELEFSLVALESLLQQQNHEVALRALKRGREWQQGLRETLEALKREELLPFVREEATQLREALATLDGLVEKEGSAEVTFTTSLARGMAVLRAAGSTGPEPRQLLAVGRRRRFRVRLKEALEQTGYPSELEALSEAVRAPLETEYRALRLKLTALRPAADDVSGSVGTEGLDATLTQVESDLRWVLLRIRKELQKQVVESVETLRRWKQNLQSGQLRFYLPEGAADALEQIPVLEATAARLSALRPGEVITLKQELRALNERLETLFAAAVPKARRYFERQLARLDAEMLQTPMEGLPERLATTAQGLQSQLSALRSALEEGIFDRVTSQLSELEGQIQRFGETVSKLKTFGSYWESQQEKRLALQDQLQSAGCHRELKLLTQASEKLEAALTDPSQPDLLALEQSWSLAMEAGADALKRASDELSRTRKEQEAIHAWEARLSQRKQELDWLRTCVKDILNPGADGLALKDGLAILQAYKRALEPVSLDLELAGKQDEGFKKWIKGVLLRSEKQFRQDFKDVIESLHEQPQSAKSLCAEVLANIDAVLGSQYADEAERSRYLLLQKKGDAYHRLFGKKLGT